MNLPDLQYLPSKTASLLKKLALLTFINRFTLIGGTALALQISHRQSEDLDFIMDGEKLDNTSIKRFISKNFPNYKLIREERDYQLDFLVDEVKLTFFSCGAVLIPFSVRDKAICYGNLNVAPVAIIASLKLAAISQRTALRDYYDLYFVSKYYIPLNDLISSTKILIPGLSPVTYSETLIFTADLPENKIESHLNPIENISKSEIAEFFIEELKKIKNSSH